MTSRGPLAHLECMKKSLQVVNGTSEVGQRRGMKTMSSVKKRCEGCKVRLLSFLFP